MNNKYNDKNQINFNRIFSKNKPSAPIDTYIQKKFLGEGSFGTVYLIQANNQTKKEYVCKNIDLTSLGKENENSALSEVSVLKKCKHPNIIEFKEVFITRKPKRVLHLITEYADNGDLEQKIKEQNEKNVFFPEKQIINWLIQICLALKYIHGMNVIHRDIKPSNIFLTKNGIIKIGDFGISKILSKNHKKTKTHIGTPNYMAPEVIESEKYDFNVDIWSLGVTFFELITFKAPFYGNSEYGLFLNIINGQKKMSINTFNNNNGNEYSHQLIDIINKMISNQPKQRPSIDEILNVPIIKKELEEFLENKKDLYKDIDLDIKESNNDNKDISQFNSNLVTIKEENEEKEYSRFDFQRLKSDSLSSSNI